jgi:hypothetical protein
MYLWYGPWYDMIDFVVASGSGFRLGTYKYSKDECPNSKKAKLCGRALGKTQLAL